MLETNIPQAQSETNASKGGRLSSTIITYISISAVGGFITILLMLFGNFEGKVSRVISTLVLFGLFTACSSYHLGKSKAAERSPLLSQVGNIYMLLLGLVLIWGTLGVNNYQDITLLPLTLCIVGLVQLGIVVTEFISRLLAAPQKQLVMSSFLTSAGMVATTFLFTFPLGLNDLTHFGEGYWRFAIAVIMFTGIMLSITGFVVWAFRSQSEPNQSAVTANAPVYDKPVRPSVPMQSIPETIQTDNHPAFQASPSETPNPYVENGVPQFAPPVAAPMAWPVFPNGQPLPAKPNGRPDFSALQTVANIYAESERQFFG
jgi:hypothetical protein